MCRMLFSWLMVCAAVVVAQVGIHAGSHLALTKGSDPNTLWVRGAGGGEMLSVASLCETPGSGPYPNACAFKDLFTQLDDLGIQVLAISMGLDTVRVIGFNSEATDAVADVALTGWTSMSFVVEHLPADTASHHVMGYVLSGTGDPDSGAPPSVAASGSELFGSGAGPLRGVDQHLALYLDEAGPASLGLPANPTFYFTCAAGSSAGWNLKAVYKTSWTSGGVWSTPVLHLDLTDLLAEDPALEGMPDSVSIDGLAVDAVADAAHPPLLISPRFVSPGGAAQPFEVLYVGKDTDGTVRALPYAEPHPSSDPPRRRLGTALNPNRGIGDFSENDPGFQQGPALPPSELDARVIAGRSGERRTDLDASGFSTGMRSGVGRRTRGFYTECRILDGDSAVFRWRVERWSSDREEWVGTPARGTRVADVEGGRAAITVPFPGSTVVFTPKAVRRMVGSWTAGTGPTRRKSYQLTIYF